MDYSKTHSVLQSRGEVSLYHPAKLTFSCKIDMTYFPFDQQTCPLKFASWTYAGDELDVSNYRSLSMHCSCPNGCSFAIIIIILIIIIIIK